MKSHYKQTLYACYFANFFQAIGSSFAIVFIPLRNLYGFSFTQFGILVSINFITQVTSDVLFSKAVDRYGFRPFSVAAPVISSLGLLLFAFSPNLFPAFPFVGFCIATFLFAAAAGLQELLLSPIVDALPIPEERKDQSMSMLHSFFAWGQIFVVLATTLLLKVLGHTGWQWIILFWAFIPLISAGLFTVVPLQQKVTAQQAVPVRQLFRSRVFYLLLLSIIFGGGAEVTMAQWSSTFIEKGLGLPKLVGDMLGVCGFSLMLALGRTLYGLFGDRIPISRVMVAGSIGAAALYLLAALSPHPLVGLVACGLTGLCVSMLWPGTVIMASRRIPMAGASMFALLSAGGDIGASASALSVGRIADWVQNANIPVLNWIGESAGLRIGLMVAALFPLACLITNLLLQKTKQK